MQRLQKLKIVVALVVVIVCWAYSPVGIRLGLQTYSPEHLALFRFLIASSFMVVLALLLKINRLKWRDIPLLASLGFFAVSLHHICLNLGQMSVSAGAASVLAQSTPIFSAVIAYILLKESISPWRWMCILLGMFGAGIVVVGDQGLDATDLNGVLILVAAGSWGIYFVLQKKYSHHYSALSMCCYTIWFGTLFLLFYAKGITTAWSGSNLKINIAVLILGIFPSAVAYLAWIYVLKYIEVSRASTMLYLIPPTAMGMAAVILQEKTSVMVLLGGSVVLISVIALNMEGGSKNTLKINS
ncbi:drug/metabolite transporter (DMT)-like permease [Acinetobacter calcoaceticus]|uniref:Drug/metabolite transporter (DMT)-like permease n=1 Tax=Acinetobacter calcoaceticus TaxID=471 RepID=A0A4R1XKG6_ACICA|nr:drug/metabolite transporter (DMT)-like permease [Acinetobacter calcoaceticus]